mmetsp:Transcript_5741/g.9515  ORF Transcript_5741/g.9515 Transcript_5741/m.9515 type:complete len:332 (-) Transcript_5741:46-1041(-)|eukprot:CAMPEP_0119016190 /NCGR_PEP_ID=MMETSP1176-20130426/11861_1 /TAXON_ID=265551 /ORGANISM="Synedropsis recta cf, Strain CCMP1620" /LENGTH=331 /DNA_ID=CAMNT_0006969525 /DNA_START=289 /DNA_END=1284 /DNA_ORIENTATION=-
MILQRLWNRWMTAEAPSCITPHGVCDWEEEDYDANDRWEQGLARLVATTTTSSTTNDDDAVLLDERPLLIHVKQTETWDCGIACLLMAMKWLQQGSNNNNTIENDDDRLDAERKSWILQTVGTESVWSIDLVFLLEEYKKMNHPSSSPSNSSSSDDDSVANVDDNNIHQFTYLFSSQTLEVEYDDYYKDLRFYQTAFGTDQARVGRLFGRAQEEDWNLVVQHHLRLHQVMELIRRPNCIAIALVDNNTIMRYQKSKKSRDSEKTTKTLTAAAPYAGHYIVLSGVTENGDLQIHNPARSKKMQRMTLALFEKAWRAKGTDNDILFLMRRQEQ